MARASRSIYQERSNFGPLLAQIRSWQAQFGGNLDALLREAHQQMAIGSIDAMVNVLSQGIEEVGRTQRGTEFLFEALLSSRNMYWDKNGFRVMNTKYLNSGESLVSKYWREIDTGIGEYISHGPVFFTDVNFSRAAEVPGEERFAPREGSGHMRMAQGFRAPKGDWVAREIHEFPGYHYSTGGWATYMGGNMARPRAVYNRILGLLPGWRPV